MASQEMEYPDDAVWMSEMIDFEAPPETQDLVGYGAFITNRFPFK